MITFVKIYLIRLLMFFGPLKGIYNVGLDGVKVANMIDPLLICKAVSYLLFILIIQFTKY